jgi:hypothetical protein
MIMSAGDEGQHWLVRILGGLILAALIAGALHFGTDYPLPIAALIGGAVGLVFFFVGGNLWEWLDDLLPWT